MKTIVIYYSSTGNTEMMANAMANSIGAQIVPVEKAAIDMLKDKDVVLLGCSAMGADQLEEFYFEPFYENAASELKNKKLGFFGSYEWSEGGPWMDIWLEDARKKGLNVLGDLRVYGTPTENDLKECEEFAKNIAK